MFFGPNTCTQKEEELFRAITLRNRENINCLERISSNFQRIVESKFKRLWCLKLLGRRKQSIKFKLDWLQLWGRFTLLKQIIFKMHNIPLLCKTVILYPGWNEKCFRFQKHFLSGFSTEGMMAVWKTNEVVQSFLFFCPSKSLYDRWYYIEMLLTHFGILYNIFNL